MLLLNSELASCPIKLLFSGFACLFLFVLFYIVAISFVLLIKWKLYQKDQRIQIEHFGQEHIIGDIVYSCCITSEDILSGQPTIFDQMTLCQVDDSLVPPLSSYVFSM